VSRLIRNMEGSSKTRTSLVLIAGGTKRGG
jgi:hypothetical protein